MFSIGNEKSILSLQNTLTALVSMCVIAGTGCNGAATEKVGDKRVGVEKIIGAELPSIHYFLSFNEVKAFRKGRSKTDILNEVQWRGNFVMAAKYEGSSACVISYKLFSADAPVERGEVVFAVFVDSKFTKFVSWFPFERVEVPYEGTTRTRFKPVKIGDIRWLTQAVRKKAVDVSELEKEVKARPQPTSQMDPGLTIAYLVLKFMGLTPTPATEEKYKRNAELRNQFNAARLKVGMSPDEVQAIFKAKPLETGKVAAGAFQVYGSNESFDIEPLLRYSNVLVLFKDGKANVIHALAGGPNWRQEVQERFSNFPRSN